MDSRYSTFTLSPIKSNPLAIRLTISNPPINLVNSTFIFDLHKFLTSLSKDAGAPKVVIISSDDKDFWIHHLDLHLISMEYPLKNEEEKEALPLFGANLQLLGELPTIFIAEVNGRAVAGGNELACNMDIRFAGPNALFGSVEAAGGLIHVGALQAMTRFIGPGRAAEYLLSASSIDSFTASRIGLVNTSFSTAEELRAHVDALALRIASSPRDGIRYTKLGIRENLAGTGNIGKDMERFQELAGKEETQGVISRVLEITEGEGGMDFELGWPERISDIWKK